MYPRSKMFRRKVPHRMRMEALCSTPHYYLLRKFESTAPGIYPRYNPLSIHLNVINRAIRKFWWDCFWLLRDLPSVWLQFLPPSLVQLYCGREGERIIKERMTPEPVITFDLDSSIENFYLYNLFFNNHSVIIDNFQNFFMYRIDRVVGFYQDEGQQLVNLPPTYVRYLPNILLWITRQSVAFIEENIDSDLISPHFRELWMNHELSFLNGFFNVNQVNELLDTSGLFSFESRTSEFEDGHVIRSYHRKNNE